MAIELALSKRKKKQSAPNTDRIQTITLNDRYSTYPSKGLTPVRLTQILRESDLGDLSRVAELFQEMTTADPDLFAVLNARKQAVTGLDYEIISGSDDTTAKEIRDFIAAKVELIRDFNASLADLLDAVPRGLSVSQIMWDIDDAGDVIVDSLQHCNQKNFRYGLASDPRANLNEIRRITDDQLVDGVGLETYKWIVHQVKATSGYPSQVQLMRTITWMYLFKNFGWKAFVIYCEIFGIPLRLGKYPAGINDETAINQLKSAVRSLGMDASGVFPNNMEIEIVEAAKSGGTDNVHTRLIELASRSYAKAILGHTGTSESTPGKLGSEDAAKEVKFDLIKSDATSLATTLTDQLIRPWVEFQFGPQDEYPYFSFVITEPEDLNQTAEYLSKAQNMGAPIPKKWFMQRFGIPEPTDNEEILEPVQRAPVLPFKTAVDKGLLGGKADLLR